MMVSITNLGLNRMEISFQNKEESKRKQEQEFLALSKSERFLRFISLSNYFLRSFPTKKREENKNNFIISIKNKQN